MSTPTVSTSTLYVYAESVARSRTLHCAPLLTSGMQSILSHIPRQTDFSRIKLYVLIYAPSLKDTALDATGNHPPPSLSSSFSNIDHVQAQAPADEARSPL